MSIYKTAALIGAGYILKDRISKKDKGHRSPSPLKQHLMQIICDKLDLLVYGSCYWRPVMSPRPRDQYISYRRYFPVKKTIEVKDIRFDTEQDAQDVLNKLRIEIARYGYVSVCDYYQFSGMPDSPSYTNHMDNKYCWKDLDDVYPELNCDGTWTLTLPDPEPID